MIALSALDKPRVGSITESRPFLPDRQRDWPVRRSSPPLRTAKPFENMSRNYPRYTPYRQEGPTGDKFHKQTAVTPSLELEQKTIALITRDILLVSLRIAIRRFVKNTSLVDIDNGNAKFDQCINLSARQPSASNTNKLKQY